jgi:ATPase subunit of ABC transporter with duplicated ATPase domains
MLCALLAKYLPTMIEEVYAPYVAVPSLDGFQTTHSELLSVRNIVLHYRQQLLTIKELQISYGEKVFISGKAGSGKSALLKLLAGELWPSAGIVLFGSQVRVRHVSHEQLLPPSLAWVSADRETNCVIIDEPASLAAADVQQFKYLLETYEGTVIVASADDSLAKRFSFTKQFELSNGSLQAIS